MQFQRLRLPLVPGGYCPASPPHPAAPCVQEDARALRGLSLRDRGRCRAGARPRSLTPDPAARQHAQVPELYQGGVLRREGHLPGERLAQTLLEMREVQEDLVPWQPCGA
ncbi:hypothetical protein NDU88_001168 [Pleurodeles waltl]|uniref:Uncharacterized protein n=1 Tax=Pleurodeles waltl TaxID=8319 RepID=A0AAV7MK90_PLEWA|nr:hypothetical protein NDU88_001168 [Pleurodeles waltl]